METKNSNDRLIIADTSGLLSLAIDTDANHHLAVTAAKGLADKQSMVVVPGEIFTETINALGKRFGHARAIETAQTLTESSILLVIDTDELIRLDALKIFRTAPAGVSFTDCLVMATADKYETREIFGFDEIFSRQGYQLPS